MTPHTPFIDKQALEAGPPTPGRVSRTKPYKALPPEETVCRIQAILRDLGMQFIEHSIGHNFLCFSYCLRLVDAARHQPFFQTLGKGRTDAYAQASAYGEMIERIQNLAFYMILKYPSEPEPGIPAGFPFKYYPDEKPLSGTDLQHATARLLRADGETGSLSGVSSALGVPFLNVFRGQTEYLPFRALQVIVGSNGMCSGNTRAEALIHGISEVLERQVLKQMFLEPFCPPDVPFDLFEGQDVHDGLCRLARDHEYDIRIKDCSMGRGLPVLGLLIQDSRGRYAFHLGADPNPVTAIERCLTEMFQGGPIPFKNKAEIPDASCDVRSSAFWRMQLHLNIRSYQGHWPARLLMCHPDYPFTGFRHPVSVSDEEDLEHLLETVRAEDWELLIRDTSFTGYPSYHVYIPGISEMTNAIDDSFVRELLAFDRYLPTLTNMHDATPEKRRETAESISRYARMSPSGQFYAADYMMYYTSHPIAGMSQGDLLNLLRDGAPPPRPAVPACFNCLSCGHSNRCSYQLISDLWRRMKTRMSTGQG